MARAKAAEVRAVVAEGSTDIGSSQSDDMITQDDQLSSVETPIDDAMRLWKAPHRDAILLSKYLGPCQLMLEEELRKISPCLVPVSYK